MEEEGQDDLEDQNDHNPFVNEVVQKAIVDRATDIHFEPHKDTLNSLPNRWPVGASSVPDYLRSFQDAIISRIKIMAVLTYLKKGDHREDGLHSLMVE